MHKTIPNIESFNQQRDFLKTSALRIHLVCFAVLIPFTLKHFVEGRYESALANVLIFCIGGFNIWSILQKNHYHSRLTLAVLLPVVVVSLLLSINNEGVIGILSCYAAIVSFYFVLPERQSWFANIVVLCTSLPMAWVVLEPNELLAFASTLVLVGLFSGTFVNVIYKQQKKLHLLAATDTLTGLLNRTILYQSLEQAIEQSKRKNIDMTIVTFDIDHFKSINDTYGHDVGDDVLRDLGALLRQRVRRTDKVFRLGGEEFMILLFGADLQEGQEVAEDLRSMISSTPFLEKHPVTVSLGVATLAPNENLTDWVKRSDEYLYIAKSSGRNKVIYQSHLNNVTNPENSPVLTVN